MGGMARRIMIDLDPVRESRDFRLLFSGQLVGMLGSQITVVAVAFQVYQLTHSSLQVGAVSLVQLAPLIAGALAGGILGDALDRKWILVVACTVLALTSGALAFNAGLAHPSVPVIYVIAAIGAGFGGVLSTAASASVASLVPGYRLMSAFASMQVVDQVAMILGPLLAGLLIEVIDLGPVYLLDAGTSLLAAVAMACMASIPPTTQSGRPGLRSFADGMRVIRSSQVLLGAYLLDLSAMVFGAPRALFPALAASVFHGGPSTLGLLYAAPACGSLLGAMTTGWLDRIRRLGLAVIVAICAWGATIATFGLVHLLWLALALLAVAGWADVISAVLRTTIVQTTASPSYRSRMASVQIAVVEGGPQLGGFESGLVATAVSTEFAIVTGGLAASPDRWCWQGYSPDSVATAPVEKPPGRPARRRRPRPPR